jgi:uncharacterized protein DUF4375
MNAIEAALAKHDNTEFAIAMSNLIFARHEAVGFAAMSEAEQTAYCADCLEREVNNGGFDQFFVNSSGDTSLETITALDRLGASHTAELVRRAVAVFPDGHPSSDRDARFDQIEAARPAVEKIWAALDAAFYEYRDDIAQLLRDYVSAHRLEFRTDAT